MSARETRSHTCMTRWGASAWSSGPGRHPTTATISPHSSAQSLAADAAAVRDRLREQVRNVERLHVHPRLFRRLLRRQHRVVRRQRLVSNHVSQRERRLAIGGQRLLLPRALGFLKGHIVAPLRLG